MLTTDEDMKDVEDRVLQMEPKQQRQLIKTLYQLERTVRPSSTAATTRDSKHNRSKVCACHCDLFKLLLFDNLRRD